MIKELLDTESAVRHRLYYANVFAFIFLICIIFLHIFPSQWDESSVSALKVFHECDPNEVCGFALKMNLFLDSLLQKCFHQYGFVVSDDRWRCCVRCCVCLKHLNGVYLSSVAVCWSCRQTSVTALLLLWSHTFCCQKLVFTNFTFVTLPSLKYFNPIIESVHMK